jgi:hypothetical protein
MADSGIPRPNSSTVQPQLRTTSTTLRRIYPKICAQPTHAAPTSILYLAQLRASALIPPPTIQSVESEIQAAVASIIERRTAAAFAKHAVETTLANKRLELELKARAAIEQKELLDALATEMNVLNHELRDHIGAAQYNQLVIPNDNAAKRQKVSKIPNCCEHGRIKSRSRKGFTVEFFAECKRVLSQEKYIELHEMLNTFKKQGPQLGGAQAKNKNKKRFLQKIEQIVGKETMRTTINRVQMRCQANSTHRSSSSGSNSADQRQAQQIELLKRYETLLTHIITGGRKENSGHPSGYDKVKRLWEHYKSTGNRADDEKCRAFDKILAHSQDPRMIQLKIPQKKVSVEQLEKEANEGKLTKAKKAGRQLFFLMHAQNCKRVANNLQCNKPQCTWATRMLAHLKQCKDQNCMVVHCRQSRQIVKHYQGCNRSDCPLCSFAIRAKNLEKARAAMPQAMQAGGAAGAGGAGAGGGGAGAAGVAASGGGGGGGDISNAWTVLDLISMC